MKRQIVQGSTSVILEVFIQDSTSTTGAGLTGLTNASGGLTCYYHINTAAASVAVSLVSMTVGTFTSSGFKEVDATNMPGFYALCLPNAAYASGTSVTACLKGAANMVPLPLEIELTQVNLQDAVRGGMTALPNAVPGAAGGVFIAGSNAATAANITGNITGNLSGSVGSVTGAVASVTGNVGGNLLGTLSSTERLAIADALLTRDQSAVSPQPALNARCPLNGIRLLDNKWENIANTLTVYKEDDATVAWSASLTVNASASPITSSDPA